MIKKILCFLNLTSHDGSISLTNVAMYVVLTKIAIEPNISIPELLTFFIVLANYAHRRSVNSHAKPEAPVVDLLYLENQITELKNSQESLDELKKTVEETKDKTSKLSLALGLTKR
jgi:hypothetical protein